MSWRTVGPCRCAAAAPTSPCCSGVGLTDPDDVRATGVNVHFCLFGLLRLDGFDTTELPRPTRESLLRDALESPGPLCFTWHRNQGGQNRLDQACKREWEALIAKGADATYAPAARRTGANSNATPSRSWSSAASPSRRETASTWRPPGRLFPVRAAALRGHGRYGIRHYDPEPHFVGGRTAASAGHRRSPFRSANKLCTEPVRSWPPRSASAIRRLVVTAASALVTRTCRRRGSGPVSIFNRVKAVVIVRLRGLRSAGGRMWFPVRGR